jgi:hypothetical protein
MTTQSPHASSIAWPMAAKRVHARQLGSVVHGWLMLLFDVRSLLHRSRTVSLLVVW